MLPLFKLHLYISESLYDRHNTYFEAGFKDVNFSYIRWINNNFVGFLIDKQYRYPINNIDHKTSYRVELYTHNNVFAFKYLLKTQENKITLNISIFEYDQEQKEYLQDSFYFTEPCKKSRICNIGYKQINNIIKGFTINYYNQWFTRLYKV